jgi:putative SOS response-associated peptidase YedK
MPVILAPEDYAEWLGDGKDADAREVDRLRHLLRPFDAKLMEAYPVSVQVNSPQNEGPACIKPV